VVRREFRCDKCGVIISGRERPNGQITADNGPPADGPPGRCVCTTCASTKNAKWGWMVPDAEYVHGPFDTRDAAIEDARRELDNPPGESTKIVLGHCRFANPVEAVKVVADLDAVLERMDEYARDNDFGFYDDNVFEPVDESGAVIALRAALEDWARQWVESSVWTLDEVETIEVT